MLYFRNRITVKRKGIKRKPVSYSALNRRVDQYEKATLSIRAFGTEVTKTSASADAYLRGVLYNVLSRKAGTEYPEMLAVGIVALINRLVIGSIINHMTTAHAFARLTEEERVALEQWAKRVHRLDRAKRGHFVSWIYAQDGDDKIGMPVPRDFDKYVRILEEAKQRAIDGNWQKAYYRAYLEEIAKPFANDMMSRLKYGKTKEEIENTRQVIRDFVFGIDYVSILMKHIKQ